MSTHYEDLKQAVVSSLESSGVRINLAQVLAKLRAELTFSVFESVDAAERVSANPQRDVFAGKEDGVVALSLVQDLLTQLGMVCTSRLFEKEARLIHPMTREQLTSRLGLPSTPPEVPLILPLVSGALAPSPNSIQEESVLASELIADTQAPPVMKPTAIKDTQGILVSFHEDDNTTPTRIPSFVGSAPSSGKLQASQGLSPDEASAPYALPSDSGESMDGDAVPSLERMEQEGEHPDHWQSNSFDIIDTSGAVDAGQTSGAVHLHALDLQEDTRPHMVQKAAPAALAPLPRKNLPPLGPVHVGDGGGVGTFNSSSALVGGYTMEAPTVRDPRREGQELLGILGSRSESEDDELPELHRLPEPDMLSDDGEFGGVAGLDLLLPDSSSDSAT